MHLAVKQKMLVHLLLLLYLFVRFELKKFIPVMEIALFYKIVMQFLVPYLILDH